MNCGRAREGIFSRTVASYDALLAGSMLRKTHEAVDRIVDGGVATELAPAAATTGVRRHATGADELRDHQADACQHGAARRRLMITSAPPRAWHGAALFHFSVSSYPARAPDHGFHRTPRSLYTSTFLTRTGARTHAVAHESTSRRSRLRARLYSSTSASALALASSAAWRMVALRESCTSKSPSFAAR